MEYEKHARLGAIHRKFNEAPAHADMLKMLIENRKGSDWPTYHLHEMLRKAEADREAARAELTRAGIRRF